MLHMLRDGVRGEVVNTDKSKEPAGYVGLVRVEVWVIPEVVFISPLSLAKTHGGRLSVLLKRKLINYNISVDVRNKSNLKL